MAWVTRRVEPFTASKTYVPSGANQERVGHGELDVAEGCDERSVERPLANLPLIVSGSGPTPGGSVSRTCSGSPTDYRSTTYDGGSSVRSTREGVRGSSRWSATGPQAWSTYSQRANLTNRVTTREITLIPAAVRTCTRAPQASR